MTTLSKMVRDKRNQPTWKLTGEIEIGRMDSSLAMTVLIGNMKTEDGTEADVCSAIGGLGVFIMHVTDKGDKNMRTYSVNCAELLKDVFRLDDELRKPKKMKPPERKNG